MLEAGLERVPGMPEDQSDRKPEADRSCIICSETEIREMEAALKECRSVQRGRFDLLVNDLFRLAGIDGTEQEELLGEIVGQFENAFEVALRHSEMFIEFPEIDDYGRMYDVIGEVLRQRSPRIVIEKYDILVRKEEEQYEFRLPVHILKVTDHARMLYNEVRDGRFENLAEDLSMLAFDDSYDGKYEEMELQECHEAKEEAMRLMKEAYGRIGRIL